MDNTLLAGIKVLDLTQIYQGPYAAFLMAQAGAEVIKVEPIGGERLRGFGGEKTPMSFIMLNSNKKSITLDLKQEKGKAMLCEMVQQADVLLENYAPGVMDRLGVGWNVLKKINPRLIYGSGTGYGLSGPDRDMLAMDHTIQAASGVMSVTGDADRPPSRAGGAPCDIMGGIHMYAGVMSALFGRQHSNKGTLVEVSMLDSMYFTLCSELTLYHNRGSLPVRNSARSPAGACPYGRYECQDGYIAIICVSESHWHNVLSVIGRTDLRDHEAYGTVRGRLQSEDEINSLIEDWTRRNSRKEASRAFNNSRVPVAPVRNLEEVKRDPHLHERGMLNNMVHEVIGELVLPSSPIRYSDYESPPLTFFPEKGAHNDEIYGTWLGLDDSQLTELRSSKVI
ncbi:MAG: CoA transferase [Gammaproteobacteria bacterium]|nr:CoA transferase [Gammaproteobacteria bacterium]